jgi:predicted nucleic acid-binding protein
MIVVSDTSAITALLQIGQAELLSALYGNVFIPEAVRNELTATHTQLPNFIRVVPVADNAYCARLLQELDAGEAEAIVLAKETKADNLLMDELDGRRVAMREGVHVIGLLGVVLEAKLRGLIPSAIKISERLEREAHFHVADSIKETIYRAAGEL